MNCAARLLTLFFLVISLSVPTLGATLESVVISNVATGSACTPGPAVATIAPTDASLIVYIAVNGGLAGDVIGIEFVRPDGVVYTGGNFNPLESAGDWCFAPSIKIAGQSATDYPGTWTVRGYWNGAPLFTRTFTLGGTSGGGATGSCPASGTNLLLNGSFELPGGSIGNHRQVPAGDPFITSWTSGDGGVDYIQTGWTASDGTYSVDLNRLTNGSLEQTVATVPGETYTLCFDLAGNPDTGPTTKTLEVMAVANGGGKGEDYSFDITGKTFQAPGWSTRTYTFVAQATETTIEFYSTTTGSAGPAIDNVRLYGAAGSSGGGGSCPASGTNRVLNPSFELPGGSIAGYRFVPAGDTFIPNWTVDRGGVDYVGTAWKASDGTYSIDMNSSTNGMLLQQIPTVPGETYTVCFDLSGNMLAGPTVKELEVAAFANGQGDGLDLTFDITGKTPQSPGWTTHSFTVVAPSSEITLEFFSNTTGGAGPLIDNVRMYGPAASGGGGGTPGCNYFISPESQTVPADGTSGIILVTTGAGCTVTATSNVPWITIQTSGSSAVGYTVAANPLSSPRVGTINISGRTVTITQEAAQPCTYNILPGSATVAAGGESRTVAVTTSGPTCGWTAASNAPWITITGGASGTGGGTVNYTAAANASTTPRTGTMTIAGKTFTVNQSGASPAGGMSLGGVVNAASYIPSNLPAGALAQGSFFSLFGSAIGPAQWVQATSFPLPASEGLGGVTIKIQKGGQEVWAALHFVASTQVNGIIPSNTPLGDCIMILTYQGKSVQIPVRIVKHNFGAFSLQAGRGPGIVQNWNSQTDVPLNTAQAPAKPGQLVVIWGTGLGPIQGPDNVEPPVGDLPYNIKVTIGGKVAEKVYGGRAPNIAAVDVLYVKVPMDAPTGCYVPVQVDVEGAFSNAVTMAVGQPGMQCEAESGIPFLDIASQGGKSGVVILLRAALLADILDTDTGASERMELELDVALGLFLSAQGYSGTGDILGYLPPIGSCQSMAANEDLGGLLEGLLGSVGGETGGDLPGGAEPLEYAGLNAGTPLTLRGNAGTMPLDLLDEEQPGVYIGLLGGTIPDLGVLGFPGSLRARLLSMPPFLDGGAYTLKGPGGRDVGAFEKQFNLPNQVRWTNRDQTATVRRNQGVTLNWSGGDNSKLVLIVGGSADEASEAVGGFLCIANASAGQFAVPASATANLPLTGSAVSTDLAGGILGMAVLPRSNMIEFSAPGLDRGLIVDGLINLRTVGVQ